MSELKIYERGHLGYVALIFGGAGLLFATVYALWAASIGEIPIAAIPMILGFGYLAFKGQREAGKPHILLNDEKIDFNYDDKRSSAAMAQIKKLHWTKAGLMIEFHNSKQKAKISLEKVSMANKAKLKTFLEERIKA